VGSLSINAITLQGEGEDLDVLGSLDMALELVGVEDDDCPGNKVLICHIPPGNPLNAKEICVGTAAVKAHVKHGDNIGECPEVFEDPTSRGRSAQAPGRSRR
jgi:hypothetical protein